MLKNRALLRQLAPLLMLLALLLVVITIGTAEEANKEIQLQLAYSEGSNGTAPADGAIGFIISPSFNWNVDSSGLCTVWNVSSDASETLTCYGAGECCSQAGLTQDSVDWNSGFEASRGDSNTATVSAQVIYAEYDAGNQTYNLVYSNLASLPVQFIDAALPEAAVPEAVVIPEAAEELTQNLSAGIAPNKTEMLVQGNAEIGKPVKWTKTIVLSAKANATTELPDSAYSITVMKKGSSSESLPGAKPEMLAAMNIAGQQFIAASGFSETPANGNITLAVNDSSTEFEVEYFTEAPAVEETASGFGKRIRIFSDFHYQDVKAYSDIRETSAKPRLYHIEDGSRVDVTDNPAYAVNFVDTNGNGLYDRVEWIVPHLSDQLFEIGVASINTRKSIYKPSEIAELVIVALDNDGRLVAGASIHINITSPDGKVTELATEIGGVISHEKGIYEASYSDTSLEGNYTIKVIASGRNTDSVMESYFTVQNSYAYDIIRATPVTTDPWKGAFASSISVVPLQTTGAYDFSEFLPIDFTVVDKGGAELTAEGGRQKLTWKGLNSAVVVSYSAVPPLVTPKLYELGPAVINGGDFVEARPWYLAVDPAGNGKRQQKTVEYFVMMNWSQITGALVASPYRNSSLINVYIPEDNPVLKSAWLDVYFGKVNATVTGGSSGIMLNNTPAWKFGISGTDTGEYILMNYLANMTGAMSALGFGKGSNNYNITLNLTLSAVNGFICAPSVKLYLTYEYDDSSPEQLYTVHRFVGQLNDSQGLFFSAGTRNSVNFSFQNMSSGMPSGYTIRDSWVEIFGVVGADTLNDELINVTLDNELQGNNALIEMSAGGPASFRLLFHPGTFDPTKYHSLNISVGGGANNVTGLSAEMVMTYSYPIASSFGRLETVRYFIDQSPTSFAAAGATVANKGNQISLPQNKVTVQDAYVIVTGHLGVATTSITDASRFITLSVSRPGVNNDIARNRINLRHSAADETQNIMSFRLLYNASTLKGLADNNYVNCTVATDGSGLSSPGCELVITYNYSYPDSPYRVKTVGFFAGSSGVKPSEAGPIAAAAKNVTANFSISYPSNEGTITIVSPYFWVTNPNVAVGSTTFIQNVSNSFSSRQTLNINNPDSEQSFAWGLYNATNLINTSATTFILGLNSPTASTYNAWAWVTYECTLDYNAPNLSIITPSTAVNVSNNFFINASINDSISGALNVNATFYNNTGNATWYIPMSLGAGTSIIGWWNLTFDTTTLQDGYYNLSINATDASGNINISQNRSVLIDNTYPFHLINISPNPANQSLNNVQINWTVIETNLQVMKGNITYPDGTLLNNFTSSFNLTIFNLTTTGNYTLTFFANDSLQHINITKINLTVNDVMPPFINLTAPAQNYASNRLLVNFSFNVSDVSQVMNCSLSLNGDAILVDNTSDINKTRQNNISYAVSQDGFYNWSVKCIDSYLNMNYSINRTILVDTVQPNMTYISPTPPNNSYINGSLTVNISSNETNPSFIQLLINGTVNTTRGYAAGMNNFTNFTITLSDGTYNFSAYINDTAGNNMSLPNMTVRIDRTYPKILYSISTPVDNYNQSSQSFIVNVTYNDTNPAWAWLLINGTFNDSTAYSTARNFTNFTLTVDEGDYEYQVMINDSASNYNQTAKRNITVDLTNPLLYIEDPGTINYTNNPTVMFKYNVSDNLAKTKNCSLVMNNIVILTNSTVVEGMTQNFTNRTVNGTYQWRIRCYDFAGNMNQSEIRNITVDTTSPVIRNESVNATTVGIQKYACINASITDTFSNISTVIAQINKPDSGLVNFTLSNATGGCGFAGGAVYSAEIVCNEEGNYTWNMTFAYDKAGNMNQTSPRSIVSWNATSAYFLVAVQLAPAGNVTINESSLARNYSFTQTCSVQCSPASIGDCLNVNLKTQMLDAVWQDTLNSSGYLKANISAYYIGTLAQGSTVTRDFDIISNTSSGGKYFATRCRGNATNAAVDFTAGINVTVNDYPFAYFTRPFNLENISGAYRLNASGSMDDQGIATYRFEYDNTSGFASPTLIYSGSNPNATFNTASTDCAEGGYNCYIRLNVTDIYGLSNATVVNVQIDNTPPTIRLNSPQNGTYQTADSFLFNYTPVDINLATCVFYHNASGWAANDTNASVLTGQATSFNLTFAEGTYKWNVVCNDSAGNYGWNLTNFTFGRDLTLPNMTFAIGTEANDTYFSRNWIFVNVSINESNIANVTFYLYNTTGLVNMTNLTGAGSSRSMNFTKLNSNMTYFYNVTVMDKVMNVNISDTRKITLDTTFPYVNYGLGTEANDTYFNRDWIFVNLTINETNFNNISFYLFDASSNLVNITNFTSFNSSINFTGITNTNQAYYYNVTVRDNASNFNTTIARKVTLDTTAPLVMLNAPANFTLTDTNIFIFNYTPTDANLKNCSLYANFSGTFSFNATNATVLANGALNSINSTLIADGTYIWNVLCYDKALNIAFNDSNYTLRIDTTPPQALNITLPLNNTQSWNVTPTFEWNSTFDNTFANYTLLVDNDSDFSSPNQSIYIYNMTNSSYTLDTGSLSNNTKYYWKMIAYDNLSHSAESQVFTYITDNITPSTFIQSPAKNYSETSSNIITFTYNANDTNDLANCSVILNTQVMDTEQNPPENTSISVSISVQNGGYNWSVNCTDRAGNTNTSEMRNLSVNVPTPDKPFGILVYNTTTVKPATFPAYRLYGGSFGTEQYASASPIVSVNWVVVKSNPVRDEFLMGTLDNTGRITLQVYNSSAWKSLGRIVTTISTTEDDYKGFDIAFEQLSGRAMIVYNSNVAGKKNYSLWNGTNLFMNGTISNSSDNCNGTPRWISMDSQPNSNNISLMYMDSAGDFCANIWNGTNWMAPKMLDSGPTTATTQRFDIAFEANSGDALAVWESVGGNGAGVIAYCAYSGGSWCTFNSSLADRGTANSWIRLSSDPASNRIMLGTYQQNTDNDFDAIEWSGSSFGSWAPVDQNVVNADRVFDIGYIGQTGNAIAVRATAATNYANYSICTGANCAAGTWTNYQNTSLMTNNCGEAANLEFIQLDADPFSNSLMMTAHSVTNHYICTQEFNGSVWGAWNSNLGMSYRTSLAAEQKMFRYNHFRDLIKPTADFITPTPSNNTFINSTTVTINASTSDNYEMYVCALEWQGINETMSLAKNGPLAYCSATKNALADGNYSFRIFANDTSGNINNTVLINITIDNTAPVFAWVNMSPNPANYSLKNVSINITATDLYLNATYIEVTYPNGTFMGTFYGTKFNLTTRNLTAPGNYTIIFYANDTARNYAKQTQYLFVNDTAAPSLNSSSPRNNTYSNTQFTYFYYNASDNFNVTNCSLVINSTIVWTNYTIYAGQNNFSRWLNDGVYLWKVNCSDTFNNVNVSETRTLTIDTDKPRITLVNLSDNINVTYTNVTFNWTVNDNLSPSVLCNITVNGVNITTFVNVSNNQMRNYTINLSEGIKTWNITCTDLAGNANVSATRKFAIVYDVDNFTAVMASDNTSVILVWSNSSAADYYEIYISTNGTFADVPNSTGMKQLNYSDDNASQSSRRFYKISGVRADQTKVTVRTTGKQTMELAPGWNMVSWPFSQLYNFTLKNATSLGYDLTTTPVRCVQEIWKYNISRPGYWEATIYDTDVWTPATGDENFTALQGGMGYWLYNNISENCNLTFAGIAPSGNTTIKLNKGVNLIGWYSEDSPALPTDCQDPYPLSVNPVSSITTIYSYNETIDPPFMGSLHLNSTGICGASDDWGWYGDISNLYPGNSYYVVSSRAADWIIQSTR